MLILINFNKIKKRKQSKSINSIQNHLFLKRQVPQPTVSQTHSDPGGQISPE